MWNIPLQVIQDTTQAWQTLRFFFFFHVKFCFVPVGLRGELWKDSSENLWRRGLIWAPACLASAASFVFPALYRSAAPQHSLKMYLLQCRPCYFHFVLYCTPIVLSTPLYLLIMANFMHKTCDTYILNLPHLHELSLNFCMSVFMLHSYHSSIYSQTNRLKLGWVLTLCELDLFLMKDSCKTLGRAVAPLHFHYWDKMLVRMRRRTRAQWTPDNLNDFWLLQKNKAWIHISTMSFWYTWQMFNLRWHIVLLSHCYCLTHVPFFPHFGFFIIILYMIICIMI